MHLCRKKIARTRRRGRATRRSAGEVRGRRAGRAIACHADRGKRSWWVIFAAGIRNGRSAAGGQSKLREGMQTILHHRFNEHTSRPRRRVASCSATRRPDRRWPLARQRYSCGSATSRVLLAGGEEEHDGWRHGHREDTHQSARGFELVYAAHRATGVARKVSID